MAVIGTKELRYIMKLDDQTRRERESLNRSLGEVGKTVEKAAASSKKSIIDMAKASKGGIEGLKAVFELGGWLMVINGVVKGIGQMTAEARKTSAEFQALDSAMKSAGNALGSAVVKAMEPAAEAVTKIVAYTRAGAESLPQVWAIVADIIKKIFSRAFEWETLKQIIINLGENMIRTFQGVSAGMYDIFIGAIKLLESPFQTLGRYIGTVISSALSGDKIPSLGDFIKADIKQKLEGLGQVALGAFEVSMAGVKGSVGGASAIVSVFEPEIKSMMSRLDGLLTPIAEKYISDAANAQKKAAEETSKGATEVQTVVKNMFDGLMTDLQSYLDQMNAAARQTALSGEQGIGAAVGANIVESGVMGSELLGDAGLSAIFAGSIGSLVKIAMQIENVTRLLNPMGTIIEAMMEVLAPVINNLLAPFVGILKVLGYLLAALLVPVLELLRPVIEMVAAVFLWLYNKVIVPVANHVIVALNHAYNGFANFINGILAMIDSIPLVDLAYRVGTKDVNAGTLSAIDMSGLYAAGAASSGGSASSSGGGAGASYAAGTTIKIEKIEINADFIAGDAGMMDVAVKMRDLILEAERIGR